MGKNIPTETRRPREDWTAIGAERLTGLNRTNVPQKKRNVPNAVNWDIMLNADGLGGK